MDNTRLIIKENERSPWERLIAGIIYCAVLDYIENYRRSLRSKPNSRQRNMAVCEMYMIERFFLSSWCATLTGDNGEKILRLTKKAAKSEIDCCKLRKNVVEYC